MKMVKVGGKEVPFFAADGKGPNDLRKAMYGIKMKRAAYGAKMEMGKGGKVYEMMGGGLIKEFEEGGMAGDPPKKFFVAQGFDNRGDDPSGRNIAAVFMRTEDGVKQINPRDLMEMFPDAKDMMEAYQMAGIPAKRSGEGVVFTQLGDPNLPEVRRHNRALMREFGAESMDELREKLNIAPVPYERGRDLKKLVPGFSEEGEM